jgi:hypothetical protein
VENVEEHLKTHENPLPSQICKNNMFPNINHWQDEVV